MNDFLIILNTSDKLSYISITTYGDIMLSHINVNNKSLRISKWIEKGEDIKFEIEKLFNLI